MTNLLRITLGIFLCIIFSNTTVLGQKMMDRTLTIDFQNPVTSQFDLQLTAQKRVDVSLSIEDKRGKQVKFLMRQELVAGDHSMPFAVSGIATGDYKLKIETPQGTTYKDLRVRNLATPLANNFGMLGGAASPINGVKLKVPNPIKSGDHIELKLEEMMAVKIFLENMEGQFTKLLMNQELMKGEHEVVVIVSDLPAGNYRLKVETPKGNSSKVLTIRDLNPNVTNISGKNLNGIYAIPSAFDSKAVKIDFKSPMRSGDELKIKVNSLGAIKMSLEDNNGNFTKLLMNQELMVGEHSVPVILSDIPAGNYILKIETFDGTSERPFRVVH